MWVTIAVEYDCKLTEEDATAIKNGEKTIYDIDTSYYIDNYSIAEITDVRKQ